MGTSLTKKEDIFNTPLMPDEYPFWICQYGHTYSDKTYHEVTTKSGVTRIEYVISGKGVINSKNISCIVSAGDTYILHEGDYHNYYSDMAAPMDKIWVNLKGELAKEIFKLYHLDDIILLNNINSREWIEELHSICDSTDDPYEIQTRTSACFLNFVQYLAREHINYQSKVDFLDDIRSYIDLHIQDNITSDDLAKLSGKSVDHTIRLFKSRFGMTPHKYILKGKLQLAMTLLHSTDESVEKISDRLNFCNVGHFSKMFIQYTGLRPSEYRKKHRESL